MAAPMSLPSRHSLDGSQKPTGYALPQEGWPWSTQPACFPLPTAGVCISPRSRSFHVSFPAPTPALLLPAGNPSMVGLGVGGAVRKPSVWWLVWQLQAPGLLCLRRPPLGPAHGPGMERCGEGVAVQLSRLLSFPKTVRQLPGSCVSVGLTRKTSTWFQPASQRRPCKHALSCGLEAVITLGPFMSTACCVIRTPESFLRPQNSDTAQCILFAVALTDQYY